MLDSRLLSHLDHHQIPFCLIGGLALAAWGVARYAADILALLGNAEALGRSSLKGDVSSFAPQLTREAQVFWVKVSAL